MRHPPTHMESTRLAAVAARSTAWNLAQGPRLLDFTYLAPDYARPCDTCGTKAQDLQDRELVKSLRAAEVKLNAALGQLIRLCAAGSELPSKHCMTHQVRHLLCMWLNYDVCYTKLAARAAKAMARREEQKYVAWFDAFTFTDMMILERTQQIGGLAAAAGEMNRREFAEKREHSLTYAQRNLDDVRLRMHEKDSATRHDTEVLFAQLTKAEQLVGLSLRWAHLEYDAWPVEFKLWTARASVDQITEEICRTRYALGARRLPNPAHVPQAGTLRERWCGRRLDVKDSVAIHLASTRGKEEQSAYHTLRRKRFAQHVAQFRELSALQEWEFAPSAPSDTDESLY